MKYLRKVGNAGGENADVVDALTNLSDDAPPAVAEPLVWMVGNRKESHIICKRKKRTHKWFLFEGNMGPR